MLIISTRKWKYLGEELNVMVIFWKFFEWVQDHFLLFLDHVHGGAERAELGKLLLQFWHPKMKQNKILKIKFIFKVIFSILKYSEPCDEQYFYNFAGISIFLRELNNVSVIDWKNLTFLVFINKHVI